MGVSVLFKTNSLVLTLLSLSGRTEATSPPSQWNLWREEGSCCHGACQRGPWEQAGRVRPQKPVRQLHLALRTQDSHHHGRTTGEWFLSDFFPSRPSQVTTFFSFYLIVLHSVAFYDRCSGSIVWLSVHSHSTWIICLLNGLKHIYLFFFRVMTDGEYSSMH